MIFLTTIVRETLQARVVRRHVDAAQESRGLPSKTPQECVRVSVAYGLKDLVKE